MTSTWTASFADRQRPGRPMRRPAYVRVNLGFRCRTALLRAHHAREHESRLREVVPRSRTRRAPDETPAVAALDER